MKARIAAITVGIFTLGAATVARAELLAYEGFDYAVGSSFIGQNGGFGFATNWIGNSAVVPNSIVLANSFTYTDSFGNSIASTGHRAIVSGDGSAAGDNLPNGYVGTQSASPYRRFSFTRGADTVNPSTTWASIIATRVGLPFTYVNASNNVARYGRGVGALQFFYNSSATSTAQGSEMVGVGRGSENSTSATFDYLHTMDTWAVLNRGDAGQQRVSEVGFASLPADFLLVRIDHNPGTDPRVAGAGDTIYIWINPPNLAKEPTLAKADLTFTPTSVSTSNDRDYLFNIVRLFGGNYNTTLGYSSIEVDELKIGTEFLDVTIRAIPEPSVFALGTLAGLAFLAVRKLRRD